MGEWQPSCNACGGSPVFTGISNLGEEFNTCAKGLLSTKPPS
jgi:hypothetical protein